MVPMQNSLVRFINRHLLASVLIICALAWVPGFFTLPPLDRDESRFAQATKQMLETRDFVDIRLGQDVRYEKPAGIYWIQAATTAVFGGGARNAIWTYRLPSFLGALAAVAAMFWLVRGFAAAESAFFAALILGLSVLLMSEAKIAKTDAVLLATITAAQAVLMRVYLQRHRDRHAVAISTGLVLLGWAAVGLGILVKGPVALIVCGTTILALVLLDRDWRWLKHLRPAIGIPLALAIVLPWAIAIGIASHGGFYARALGQDFALKAIGEQEAHGAPPGYFTALTSFTFWPGTLLLLPALVIGWMRRKEPAIRFLLVWAATTFLVFELVPTKLPHYVLPAYPALAALCAMSLQYRFGDGKRALRIARYLSLALFVAVGGALAVFVAIAPLRLGSGAPWWLFACSAAAAAIIFSAIPPVLANHSSTAMLRASAAAILIYGIAGFITAPRLTELWLSPRLADAVTRHSLAADPPVVTAGYAEPSITFLLGTRTALADGATAGRRAAHDGGLVLVSDDQRNGFLSAVSAEGARANPLEEIGGLNYSRGRTTRITLYRVATPGH